MRRKIDFQQLINFRNGYGLSLQLDTFAWMIQTNALYRGDSRYGGFEWLYGLSAIGCWPDYANDYGITQYRVETFLRAAFVRAIVDTSAPQCVLTWRQEERVALGQYRMLNVGNIIPHSDLQKLLNTGWKMTQSPNSYHPEATTVHEARMTVNAHGWQVLLIYGFDDPNTAGWKLPLLEQRTQFAADAVTQGLERIKELTN
jgi:hypothetical protein